MRAGAVTALQRAAGLVRPVALAHEQVHPVVPALAGLLPAGGLQRGATVAVGGAAGHGATSLAFALVSAASAAGAWVAVVGLPSVGLAAAGEYGVALERLVLVASPPRSSWPQVVATTIDTFEVVLLAVPEGVRPGDVRRLQARARERGAVLVVLGDTAAPGVEADVRLEVVASCWSGVDEGAGTLRARRVQVRVGGRRAAARRREVELWLPGPHGEVAVHERSEAPVTPRLREVG